MKLVIKKIYCPACQTLVAGREQKADGNTSVLCGRCGRLIWVWEGIRWRYAGKMTD